ncbi:MAG: DUF1080 domain-containing protein [Saprospiraceae bacterium]|nr:DUF1080 domain-containing protein [Saprospiraceae bacterium]
MKQVLWLLIFAGLYLGCGTNSSEDFTAIFDGQTWQGWEGSKDFFRIEAGAIVAGALDREIPKNQFLCTEEIFGDFELRMQVKFTSKENNAGIQFRSERIPNDHEVIGYQADIGFLNNRPLWGSLYDESRRKLFLLQADPKLVSSVVDVDAWNDYRILCQGQEIKFWLNDTLVLEYEEFEEDIAQEGAICVQIHSGVPAEAWYKNIEIRKL